MEFTERELQIIDAAVEKALLMLPDAIGNLMAHHAMLNKMNKEFYGKYPDFAKHKDIVAKSLEAVETENPGMDYKEILEKAVPIIRNSIGVSKGLNTTSIGKPSRVIGNITDNGAI